MDDVRGVEGTMPQSSAGVAPGANTRMSSGGSYAEWIALGAIVAGSVGAIVGARRNNHRNAHHHAGGASSSHPDPATLTAPHGDKLSPLV